MKQGQWQRLHVEYTGDKLVACLNGEEMRAEHPYRPTPKVRWWFAASDQVQVRDVRCSAGVALK